MLARCLVTATQATCRSVSGSRSSTGGFERLVAKVSMLIDDWPRPDCQNDSSITTRPRWVPISDGHWPKSVLCAATTMSASAAAGRCCWYAHEKKNGHVIVWPLCVLVLQT